MLNRVVEPDRGQCVEFGRRASVVWRKRKALSEFMIGEAYSPDGENVAAE